MFAVEIRADGVSDLLAELDGIRDFRPDLSGVGAPITQVIQDAHQRARLAGLDKDGKPLAPLAASTLKNRDGTGEPLTPHGAGSRAYRNLAIDVTPTPTGVTMRASIIGAGFLKYHATGAGRLPVRDILGIQPEAAAAVDQIIGDAVDGQIRALQAGDEASSPRVFGRSRR